MSLAENGFDAETTGVIHKESLVSLELNIQSVVLSACKAFNLWHLEKDRKSYFQKINFLIEKFCAYDEQCIVNSVINYFSHSMNIINFSENSSDQKYFTVQKKIPIGVIVIYISSTTDSAEMFATLLTPPLAIGNAVIIVLNDNSVVPPIIQILQKNLPKDLLQVINKEEAAYALAGEQNVQVIYAKYRLHLNYKMSCSFSYQYLFLFSIFSYIKNFMRTI